MIDIGRTRRNRHLAGGKRRSNQRAALKVELLEARHLLSFLPQVPYPAGSSPLAVTVADLTGSGVQDLITANTEGDSVSVLLGNGDGTFGPPADFAAGQAPWSVAVADFNGDGIPDLAVADLLPYPTGTVTILLGNGDGSFKNAGAYPVEINPRSVVAADFNGDGLVDLAVDNTASQTISVLLGNGDGTFQAAQDYAVGFSFHVAVGDLNGDGICDLVAANAGSNNVSVLLGNGDGTFQAAVNYAAGSYPFAVAIGDVNNDGIPDLVTANELGNDVSVLLGNGDGSFQRPVDNAVGNAPLSVALGDFNNDGNLDLAVADSGTIGGAAAVSVLLGNGDGTFQPVVNSAVDGHPYSVAVGDFNGDGFADLVTANSISNNVSVFLNAADWGPSALPGGRLPAAVFPATANWLERNPILAHLDAPTSLPRYSPAPTEPAEAPDWLLSPAHAGHLIVTGFTADDLATVPAGHLDGWWGSPLNW
jgi:hypothetical protein